MHFEKLNYIVTTKLFIVFKEQTHIICGFVCGFILHKVAYTVVYIFSIFFVAFSIFYCIVFMHIRTATRKYNIFHDYHKYSNWNRGKYDDAFSIHLYHGKSQSNRTFTTSNHHWLFFFLFTYSYYAELLGYSISYFTCHCKFEVWQFNSRNDNVVSPMWWFSWNHMNNHIGACFKYIIHAYIFKLLTIRYCEKK